MYLDVRQVGPCNSPRAHGQEPDAALNLDAAMCAAQAWKQTLQGGYTNGDDPHNSPQAHLKSDRNPTLPAALLRTAEKMITSFSRPWCASEREGAKLIEEQRRGEKIITSFLAPLV